MVQPGVLALNNAAFSSGALYHSGPVTEDALSSLTDTWKCSPSKSLHQSEALGDESFTMVNGLSSVRLRSEDVSRLSS